MQYMVLIYGDEKAWAARSRAATGEVVAAYEAYTKALQAAGALVSANRLADSGSASTLRMRDGKRQVLDGPYAETKEQLAGFYLVDCKDLDEAIEVASRIPGAAHGSVEVRPIWEM